MDLDGQGSKSFTGIYIFMLAKEVSREFKKCSHTRSTNFRSLRAGWEVPSSGEWYAALFFRMVIR